MHSCQVPNTQSCSFLSKFDTNGNFLWSRSWSADNNPGGVVFNPEVCVDDYGGVYLAGDFIGEVDFDPGPGVEIHDAGYYRDGYISKFYSDGSFLWTRSWGGISTSRILSGGISIDDSDMLYVTGEFKGTIDFDPGPEIEEISAYYDSYISKFSLDGQFEWVRIWGGENGYVSSYGISTDNSGGIYSAGHFSGTIDFDPGEDVYELTANIDGPVYLSRIDSNGNFHWVCAWGDGKADTYVYGVCRDNWDYIYVTGTYQGCVDFDPGPGNDSHCSPGGGRFIYLSKFNKSGDYQYAKTWGGSSYGNGSRNVTADIDGNVYVVGIFHSTVDFDPGPGEDERTCTTHSKCYYLSKFNSNGDYLWVNTWGGGSVTGGRGIACDGFANSYVAGKLVIFPYDGPVDFDPGPDVDEYYCSGCAFLVKYAPDGYW